MNKFLILGIAICLISGCTVLPKPQQPVSIYDFGVQPSPLTKHLPEKSQQVRKSVLVADAAAPAWLDTTAIHYRLLYHNPTQTYTYASNRWIAAPAALLTQQLRHRIVTNTHEQVTKDFATAKTDFVLHIELEEFMQSFDTAADSHIAIGFRASLVERNTRKLIAQKDFNRSEKTASADAAGAVSAFSAASNRLIDELIDWLVAELPRQ